MTISLAGVKNALGAGVQAARSLPFHVAMPRVRRHHVHAGLKLSVAIAVVMTGSVAVRQALSKEIARNRAYYLVEAASQGFSDRALTDLMAGAGPGAVWIAAAHNPDAPQRAWKRPDGWKRLDIDTVPTLQLGRLTMADAERINSVIPDSPLDSPPTEPFVLRASGPERARAVRCMTAAIYYEAALEPRAGQEAVAQVVLNRMRHAGYPKSVCGVVFQGSDRPGCQFSFACDGSMARPPAAWAWNAAEDVAKRALDGYVMKDVGTATHYHTAWIMAPWTPTLVKVRQVGSQIFFRPTGPEGQPAAFTERYLGGEGRIAAVDLIGRAPPPQAADQPLVVAAQDAPPPDGRVHMTIPASATSAPEAPAARPTMHEMIALRAAAAKAGRLDGAAAPATPAAESPPAAAPAAAQAG